MKLEWMAIGLISGVGLALQVGMNNTLRVRMGHPILAAASSFLTGTTALAIYLAIARPTPPDREMLAKGPWWMWCGGLVGAAYIASAATFAVRLGMAPWFALIVTGQILASLTLDHFGLVGFPRRPLSASKLVGAFLLLAGLVLVLRPSGGEEALPGPVPTPPASR